VIDSRLGRAVVTLPLRRPVATLVLAAIATVVAVFAWRTVRLSPDVRHLLPAGHPHVRIGELLDERARPARASWILLRGDDLAGRVPAIAARLAASPLVAAVTTTRDELLGEAAARARAAPAWFVDDAQRAAIAETLRPEGLANAVAALKLDLADDPIAGAEVAVRDPLGLRWVLHDPARRLGFATDTDLAILADGRAALVRVTGTFDAYDAERSTELMAHLDAVLRGEDHAVFGGYAVAAADQARIRADFERASWVAVFAIAIYLVVAMRGLRLPLVVQVPAMLSITWAVPLGDALFGPLPTVAVAAVAVLCGLGVDFAIHYAAKYRNERLSFEHDEAVARVQRSTVPELLIDMATTAVTFLAIGGGQLAGLSSFGWLLALGLLCSVVVTLTVLPVLLRFVRHRVDPERSVLAAAADRWLGRRAARPVAWLTVLGLVGAAATLHAFSVPLSADPDALRPAADPVAAARRAIEARAGFATSPVVLLAPANGDLGAVHDGLQALQRDGVVRFWSGLDPTESPRVRAGVAAIREAGRDFVAAAERALRGGGLEPAPFAPALAELHERLFRDPLPIAPLALDVDGAAFRAITMWPVERQTAATFAAFTDVVRRHTDARVQVHGAPTVQASLEELLGADLERACAIAAVLALVMVTVWQRSLLLGLLALLPSALGLLATLVLLAVIDLPLSITSFVAVPFVLGIGVDEGVHMVGQFRRGGATTGATGVGVVRTSVGTVLGFSALLFAASPGLRDLGALVAFGSFASMLACLFVQAPLLAPSAAAGQSRAQQNQ